METVRLLPGRLSQAVILVEYDCLGPHSLHAAVALGESRRIVPGMGGGVVHGRRAPRAARIGFGPDAVLRSAHGWVLSSLWPQADTSI